MVDGCPCLSYICSWERQLVWTSIHFTGLLPSKLVNLCSHMRMREVTLHVSADFPRRLGILGDNPAEDVIAAIMVVTNHCQKANKNYFNKWLKGYVHHCMHICFIVST